MASVSLWRSGALKSTQIGSPASMLGKWLAPRAGQPSEAIYNNRVTMVDGRPTVEYCFLSAGFETDVEFARTFMNPKGPS